MINSETNLSTNLALGTPEDALVCNKSIDGVENLNCSIVTTGTDGIATVSSDKHVDFERSIISYPTFGLQAGKHCFTGPENYECSLMLLKPDAMYRGLVGEIISRVEKTGYKIVAAQIWAPTRELVELHYEHLSSKDFFPTIVEYLTSGQVMAIVWRGPNVIQKVRLLTGDTDPLKALPGTIRGDFGTSIEANLVHTSDSAASAKREIQLWGLW